MLLDGIFFSVCTRIVTSYWDQALSFVLNSTWVYLYFVRPVAKLGRKEKRDNIIVEIVVWMSGKKIPRTSWRGKSSQKEETTEQWRVFYLCLRVKLQSSKFMIPLEESMVQCDPDTPSYFMVAPKYFNWCGLGREENAGRDGLINT